MSMSHLKRRLEWLEQRANTGKDVPPEVRDAVAELEGDPELRRALEEHGKIVEAVHGRIEEAEKSGKPAHSISVSAEEEESLARSWDVLDKVARRIARRHGLPVRDVLRALIGGEAQ